MPRPALLRTSANLRHFRFRKSSFLLVTFHNRVWHQGLSASRFPPVERTAHALGCGEAGPGFTDDTAICRTLGFRGRPALGYDQPPTTSRKPCRGHAANGEPASDPPAGMPRSWQTNGRDRNARGCSRDENARCHRATRWENGLACPSVTAPDEAFSERTDIGIAGCSASHGTGSSRSSAARGSVDF